MIPEVGAVCRFDFTAKFATLNGVYRIRAETTFQDALVSGIDFVANLYVPAGLNQTDFNTDYSGYLKDRIVVLESVIDTTTVYYVPESAFGKVPDPTIKEYFPLVAVVDLGIQKNTQMILPLLDTITDLIQASLGTQEPVRIITNPESKIYLTDDEYQQVVMTRLSRSTDLIPLSVQLKTALDANVFLAAKCAAYEALIRQTQEVSLPPEVVS
jgi:hypothetical protein